MKLAKAARVGGLLPTLAVTAILVVAGCGGESTDETATTGTAKDGAESGSRAGVGAGVGEQQNEKDEEEEGEDGPPGTSGPEQGGVPQPEGKRESGITQQQRSKATTASITLESPNFNSDAALPVNYTCDGKNESPPLHWSGIPPEAAELVLLVLNYVPVNEKLFFDWAVAGLDPSLSSLDAGILPPGAVVGKNSFGEQAYSICPDRGSSENYVFMLFAIPEALSPEPGFEPLGLREAVLGQSGNVGILSASHTRP